MKRPVRQHQGSLLIDVLLAIGVAGLFGVALVGLVRVTSQSIAASRHQSEAASLAKASMEAVVAVKNEQWSNIRFGNVVALRTGNQYVLQPMEADEVVNSIYRRRIDIAPGFRDTAGRLSPSGTPDPAVAQVTVTVRWIEQEHERQVQYVHYLTNWKSS